MRAHGRRRGGIRSWTALVASACMMTACGESAPPGEQQRRVGAQQPTPRPPQPSAPKQRRLLARAGQVTLGNETRLASADSPRLVLREKIASGGHIPSHTASPWTNARRVLLHARAWRGSDDRVHERAARNQADAWTVIAPIEEAGITLGGLAAGAPDPPYTLQVMALRLPTSPVQVQAEVLLPATAVLAFGYGLGEESWGASAPVRFQARARAGDVVTRLFEATLDPSEPSTHAWQETRIDLSALGGRRVVLSLEASWEAAPGSFALPVFADPTVYVPGAAAERPNVVLVSLDTLRARSLGAYGYPRDTSPFLDELVQQGVLFESAMTTSATTAPSHMSLLTGLYPVHHGLAWGNEWKRSGVQTLAGVLRKAGYRTAAFTENGFIVRRKGFGEGFATYVENRQLPERPRDVRATFGQARRWIEANDRSPFFVFLHTYQVHSPYEPPPAYRDLFRSDGLAGPSRADVRGMRDDYDREIRHVDDELRGLFETLRASGDTGSTLVIVTADHGEEFGERGWLGHGSTVYEEVMHVPLLFWAPERLPAGRRIAAPVSLIDVVPTLVSLLGLPLPADLDGIDLSAVMLAGEEPPARSLFAEARAPGRLTGPKMLVHWNPPLVTVRSGASKFIVHRPPHGEREPTRLYDLASDPGEHSPRLLEGAEKQEIEDLVDRYLSGAAPGSAPPADAPGAGFDPETEAQLRGLGYLD